MPFDRPDPACSLQEADRRLAIDPRDIGALLAKADNLILLRDFRSANAFYGFVVRLSDEGIEIASPELNRAREALDWLAQRFREGIVEGLAQRGITKKEMHPRFAKSLEIMFGVRQRGPVFHRYPQMPNMYFYPDLPHIEFADLSGNEWVRTIQTEERSIQQEASKLLARTGDFAPYVKKVTDRPQGDVHGLLDDPSWSTFDLTDKGQPIPDRVRECPQTFRTITQTAPLCAIPNRAPSVMFSLLRAKSRIPPHTGMINTRLICHLPLEIPGEGALRVGASERAWQVNELLVFDDTVEHEAWNNAASDRLVLIFDIWRPEIEPVEREQICKLFATVDAY